MNPYLEKSPRSIYLAHLSERLDNLGYNIPMHMFERYSTTAILSILSQFGLSYCIHCKLPCAPEDMDSVLPNTCKEHAP